MRLQQMTGLSAAQACAVTATILALVGFVVSADAAPGDKSGARKASAVKLAASLPAATVRPAAPIQSTPLITVVSIGDQRVSVFAGDTQVARAGVSTGMSGHRTPTGIFSVIGKERYHESNLYSNAPMPFMQRITWSGVAMHEGNLPGYPASHGCIRLSGDFAQRLFGMSRMGMRVIVADRDLAPVSFAHATLPSPTFTRASQVAALGAGVLPGAIVPAGRMLLGALPADASNAGRLLNPIERGRLEQGRAKMHALEAQADAQVLIEIASQRGQEARTAADAARVAESNLRSITAGRDAAVSMIRVSALGAAPGEIERTRLDGQRAALDAAHSDALRAYGHARGEAQAADAAAFHAAAEAKAAVAERDAADQTARIAARATEPVSIFISRKERRVFVRQGFEPVFEADIDIADPQTPLGTHVFTAVAAPDATAAEGGASSGAMKWVALTIPGQARVDAPPVPRGAKPAASEVRGQVVPAPASAALDRIKFSDDVLEAISGKLWTGASLIISDHGISTETGKGTDFVVLTK